MSKNNHCPQCHVGKLNLNKVTAFPIIDEMTVIVPNVPIWKCDVCAWTKFQPEVAEWLESMIKAANGVSTGLKTSKAETGKNGIWKMI